MAGGHAELVWALDSICTAVSLSKLHCLGSPCLSSAQSCPWAGVSLSSITPSLRCSAGDTSACTWVEMLKPMSFSPADSPQLPPRHCFPQPEGAASAGPQSHCVSAALCHLCCSRHVTPVAAGAACSSRVALMLQSRLATDRAGRTLSPGNLPRKGAQPRAGLQHTAVSSGAACSTIQPVEYVCSATSPVCLLACPFLLHSWNTCVTYGSISATSICVGLFHQRGMGTLPWCDTATRPHFSHHICG